jgi:N-terminal domain of (some) glycogen debranching enzymes
MSDPWSPAGDRAPLGSADGTITLVEGSAFCISGRTGNLAPGGAQGLFFRDTRFLSRLEVRVNGATPERLAATVTDPFSAAFVSRVGRRSW